jgi:XRE family aerobic/anaerobic benzoate catabolism transcriptional regulator
MHAKINPTPSECPDLLGLIGNRVRGLRAHRGMTRKSLVAESGVSERHLAQLEMGRGNMSIALLERVARALETDLGDLVRDGQDENIEQILINEQLRMLSPAELKSALALLQTRYFSKTGIRRRIALIGLRGAGKTTFGKQLAAHRKVPFIRLVAELERLAGMDASVIFELSGQSGYRRLEEKALTETLNSYHTCVIEVGGSIVANPDLFDLLLASCTVVWIRALPEQHMQRVIDQGDLRPMAGNDDAMSDLKRILDEREPFYAKAHCVLDTSTGSVKDCAAELVKITHFDETDGRRQKLATQ